jgi:murein DD-endopeptidase MepM/ murein hydrolase activator NlpD
MADNESPLRRVSGHLILLLVTALIVIGWRTSLSGEDQGGVDGSSPTPVPTSAVGATIATAEPGVSEPQPQSEFPLAQLPVIRDFSLAPAPNPFTFQGKLPEHTFERYVVERGDTPDGIASQFGIQAETLLGGNPRLSEESSLLQTGVELIILPIDGVLHDVEPGDTLEELAALYGVETEDIIAYEPNHLEFPYRLYPDTQIMVPGGVREVFVWTPPDLSSVTRNTSYEGSGVTPIIVGTGTFIYPVSGRRFTQYYWYGHQAVDIAVPEGTAVYASDTGTVTFAGWNVYGYGNLIVVNHGNGFETFYAHLSGMNVVPGQIVYQGNVIGATGNTGRSSGPHIHFEIRINNSRDNPCWYIGC